VTDDPEWGPVLTLGAGGKLVELLDDLVHLVVPTAATDVRGAIARLGVHRVLQGYRDVPPADVDAVVTAVMRLQHVFLTHIDELDEIELNPLIVRAAGKGVCLVDVLVTERRK
jgi:acetate---CoA ligase (ADP-forming)